MFEKDYSFTNSKIHGFILIYKSKKTLNRKLTFKLGLSQEKKLRGLLKRHLITGYFFEDLARYFIKFSGLDPI